MGPDGYEIVAKGVRLEFYCDKRCKNGVRCKHITPIKDYTKFSNEIDLAGLLRVIGDQHQAHEPWCVPEFRNPNQLAENMLFAPEPEIDGVNRLRQQSNLKKRLFDDWHEGFTKRVKRWRDENLEE